MKHLLLTALLLIASSVWAAPIDESKTADMKEKRLAASKGNAMAQWQVEQMAAQRGVQKLGSHPL